MTSTGGRPSGSGVRRVWTAIVAVLLLAGTLAVTPAAGAAPAGGATAPPARTDRCALPGAGQDFGRAAPESMGLDPAAVRAAVTYATARGAQSVRVYRRGCLVAEGGTDPAAVGRRLAGYSMTKSVVSLAVGRADALGLLDVDAPIGPALRAAGYRVDATKSALTPRHFLNQTSGIRMAWASDLAEVATTDSVQAVLDRPFEAVPGSTFIYAQTAVSVLAAAVEGATGRDFQDFVRTELFRRVGIGDDEWRWARDPAGNTIGFAGLDMTPRAFARLGTLAERGGDWGGRRLIARSYLRQAAVGTDSNPCYGFLMRSNRRPTCANDGVPAVQVYDRKWLPPAPSDTFGFSGAFDQDTIMYPGLDLVVVRMGFWSLLTPDPFGQVRSRQPAYAYRFHRLLMRSVVDQPQPEVPDWTPDPDPPPLDVLRILPLPVPEPWPVRGG